MFNIFIYIGYRNIGASLPKLVIVQIARFYAVLVSPRATTLSISATVP